MKPKSFRYRKVIDFDFTKEAILGATVTAITVFTVAGIILIAGRRRR